MAETNSGATAVAEPSMAELRDMFPISGEPGKAAAKPADTSEPVRHEAEAKTVTSESEPEADQQQQEVEEELPEGVRKKIEKETRRAAIAQSKIDQAVSARKAKEAEAAALEGKSGPEPAKQTTESPASKRPVRPDLNTFPGTLAEYNAAVAKHDIDLEAYLLEQTKQTVAKEFSERQVKEALAREWEAASKEHGADFQTHMQALADSTPEPFQIAVSGLENWAAVAVHLAKNEAERAALVDEFKTNPYAAIAKLGKLEDRLTAAATKHPAPKEPAKALPAPLRPAVNGVATHKSVPLDQLPMSQFTKEMAKLGL